MAAPWAPGETTGRAAPDSCTARASWRPASQAPREPGAPRASCATSEVPGLHWDFSRTLQGQLRFWLDFGWIWRGFGFGWHWLASYQDLDLDSALALDLDLDSAGFQLVLGFGWMHEHA